MAENIVVDVLNNKSATVYVSRKVSVKQYESMEVGIHLPVELPERIETDDDASYSLAVATSLQGGINLLKVQVFDSLGLKYTDEQGVIAETVEAHFAPPKASAPPRSAPAPSQAAPQADTTAADGGVPACPECKGAMYDNRATKKGRQPDYKCKDRACNKAIWLDKK